MCSIVIQTVYFGQPVNIPLEGNLILKHVTANKPEIGASYKDKQSWWLWSVPGNPMDTIFYFIMEKRKDINVRVANINPSGHLLESTHRVGAEPMQHHAHNSHHKQEIQK